MKLEFKKISIIGILLFSAIIAGTIVRTWKITSLPFPPNGDELSFGYFGWSLLHFGTDEYGTYLPINFPSIGDYKYPGLAYLNIIPAAIFGLSEITTRFWSVISGIILIPLIYLLVIALFENRKMALVASWLTALSPWSITLSRLGYENHVALTLTVAGFICLLHLRKIHKKKTKALLFALASFLLILATFTYGAQRVFIPLILTTILVLSFVKNSSFFSIRKHTVLLLVILAITISISLIPWQNRGRAEAVMWKGISSAQANRLQELYVEAGISPIKIPVNLTHLFHNKLRVSVEDFLYRYSNYFSSKFLFFEGEAATERIPDTGMLPLILIFFLPLGLLMLFTHRNKQSSLFVLAWLLFAPIPSSLTLGEPHINRSSLMIPAITIISAFGFWQFLNFFSGKKKFIFGSLFSLLFFFNSLYVLNQIFIQKPVSKPWISEQVNKQLVKDVFTLKDRYQAVAIPKDEYIFFLFYGKIPPQDFIKRSSIKPATKQSSWDRVEKLDNIYFNMVFDCPKGGKLNVLYICKGPNIPQNSKVVNIIRYLDDVPAYTFIEFYPISQMPPTLPKLPERLKYMVDVEKNPKSPDGIIPDNSPDLW
ncbi:glycosyltransferase family 39 protein [Patescibacteria group bacterium]|nr:glycosyltransferase family 39 protein [Patescibacteria group bacterium]